MYEQFFFILFLATKQLFCVISKYNKKLANKLFISYFL